TARSRPVLFYPWCGLHRCRRLNQRPIELASTAPLRSPAWRHRLPHRCRRGSRSTARSEPPVGDDWLFEVKHDGHRLAVIADGDGGVRLLSRNGHERSRHFGPVFADLAQLGRQIVLDGEIAAPDERGVTHLDDLAVAM